MLKMLKSLQRKFRYCAVFNHFYFFAIFQLHHIEDRFGHDKTVETIQVGEDKE
jgi:hypothetical protein